MGLVAGLQQARSLTLEISPELRLVLVIIFFNKYFTLASALTLFATDEYGLSDVKAGELYGLWGLLHAVWGFAGSFAIDRFGIRAVAIVATTFGVLSRGLLVFTHSVPILYFVLCGLGPLAEGICDPLYMVAIKKLTRRRVRAFAFAAQYAFMNLGGAFGLNLLDVLRQHSYTMPWGEEFSGLRFTLLTTWFAALVCWLLACRLSRVPVTQVAAHWSPGFEANAFNQASSAGYVALLHPSPDASPCQSPRSPPASLIDTCADFELHMEATQVEHRKIAGPEEKVKEPQALSTVSSSLRDALELLHDDAFQRATALTTAVLFVSLQWKYMDTLLPKFVERTFNAQCPWASIYSINSWMCVFCPPLISAFMTTDRIDDLTIILLGLWIMALSPVAIALHLSEASTAAWIFLLSVGEVIWSPRSQSFIASLAPEGREGAFLAMAGLPTFISQYPVGIISGWLLDTYCPACPQAHNSACAMHDPHWQSNPQVMWLIVAGSSTLSPVLVAVLSGYFRGGACSNVRSEVDMS